MEKNAEGKREVVELKGYVFRRGQREPQSVQLTFDGNCFVYVAPDFVGVEVSEIRLLQLYETGRYLALKITPMRPPNRCFYFEKTQRIEVQNFFEELKSRVDRAHQPYGPCGYLYDRKAACRPWTDVERFLLVALPERAFPFLARLANRPLSDIKAKYNAFLSLGIPHYAEQIKRLMDAGLTREEAEAFLDYWMKYMKRELLGEI